MTNKATLSLKLPPELRWTLPKLVRTRVYGTLCQINWAEEEHRRALQQLDTRKKRETEQRRRLELQQKNERRRQEELARQRARAQFNQRFHETWEFLEEPMPAHGSQKGWRRNLSELPRRGLGLFFCEWGAMQKNGHRDKKRNRGRKPRKPWFRRRFPQT